MIIYNIDGLPAESIAAAVANKASQSEKLRADFEVAIASDVIMSSTERIERMLDAFKIPVSDDQSYNRFYYNAQRDLEVEAAKIGAKNNSIPVLPKVEEIHALARKRYDDKAAKDQKKAEANAAKEEKEKKPAN
jgi:hypothetical protein